MKPVEGFLTSLITSPLHANNDDMTLDDFIPTATVSSSAEPTEHELELASLPGPFMRAGALGERLCTAFIVLLALRSRIAV